MATGVTITRQWRYVRYRCPRYCLPESRYTCRECGDQKWLGEEKELWFSSQLKIYAVNGVDKFGVQLIEPDFPDDWEHVTMTQFYDRVYAD